MALDRRLLSRKDDPVIRAHEMNRRQTRDREPSPTTSRSIGLILCAVILTLPFSGRARAKAAPHTPSVLHFMEPHETVVTDRSAPTRAPSPQIWKTIDDPARLKRLAQMADNEAALFARSLHALAWRRAHPQHPDEPVLHIGLIPGGNFARVGFSLRMADGTKQDHSQTPYLMLGDKPSRFRTTFLHETAHVIEAELLPAAGDDDENAGAECVTSIPHTTAAITDRDTAFSEGLAIHLETVNAHCAQSPQTRRHYHRRSLRHGPGHPNTAELYAPVWDMATYAQTFARYASVRDGLYAFEPAIVDGGYLRTQVDPARDRRRLRQAGALMANEGFVASVLFQIITAEGCEGLAHLHERYDILWAALARARAQQTDLDDLPLIELLGALRQLSPSDGERAVMIFLDLSRGVTIDRDAAADWARIFDAALNVDHPTLKTLTHAFNQRHQQWNRAALEDIHALTRQIGPVIPIEIPAASVRLKGFGMENPLCMDLNAAGPALLRQVPDLTAVQIAGIVDAVRRDGPFRSKRDFHARTQSLRLPAALRSPQSRHETSE